MRRPVLHISDILAYADEFHAHVGRWPRNDDGKITGQLGFTWCAVDQALRKGNRGLPKGSSLAKLLLEHRGRRHKMLLPHFTPDEILAWADAYHERCGKWPTLDSGPVAEAPKGKTNGTFTIPGKNKRYIHYSAVDSLPVGGRHQVSRDQNKTLSRQRAERHSARLELAPHLHRGRAGAAVAGSRRCVCQRGFIWRRRAQLRPQCPARPGPSEPQWTALATDKSSRQAKTGPPSLDRRYPEAAPSARRRDRAR
jgi:hypothetical protein